MRRRALLWLAGVALVVGALLLTDALLWRPGLSGGTAGDRQGTAAEGHGAGGSAAAEGAAGAAAEGAVNRRG
jgi:hypothetical protein